MKSKAKTTAVKKYNVGGFSGRASSAAKKAQGQIQAAQQQVKAPMRQLPGATPAQLKQAELQKQQQKQGNVTSRSFGDAVPKNSPPAPSSLKIPTDSQPSKGITPLSPAEALKARDAYRAEQIKNSSPDKQLEKVQKLEKAKQEHVKAGGKLDQMGRIKHVPTVRAYKGTLVKKPTVKKVAVKKPMVKKITAKKK